MNQVQQIIHEALIKMDRIPKEQRNPKWFNHVNKHMEEQKIIASEAVNMNHPLNALLSDSQPVSAGFGAEQPSIDAQQFSAPQFSDVAKCTCPPGAVDRQCPVHGRR